MSLSEHVKDHLAHVRALTSSGATVVVVEGETDVSLLQGLIDDVELTALGGRGSVLALAGVVPNEAELQSVVLVADADFDRITGRIRDYDGQLHLVFTDAHDVEVMIVSVDELRLRVLRTLFRCSVVDALRVWTPALEFASEMGLVRLVAHLEGWSVRLGNVNFDSVQNPDGTTNRGAIVAEIMPRLKAADIKAGPGEVMRLIENSERWRADWPQLVNGHELCTAISSSARRSLGRTVGGESIESHLRVAYQRSHLAETRLGAGIRAWCVVRGRAALI